MSRSRNNCSFCSAPLTDSVVGCFTYLCGTYNIGEWDRSELCRERERHKAGREAETVLKTINEEEQTTTIKLNMKMKPLEKAASVSLWIAIIGSVASFLLAIWLHRGFTEISGWVAASIGWWTVYTQERDHRKKDSDDVLSERSQYIIVQAKQKD